MSRLPTMLIIIIAVWAGASLVRNHGKNPDAGTSFISGANDETMSHRPPQQAASTEIASSVGGPRIIAAHATPAPIQKAHSKFSYDAFAKEFSGNWEFASRSDGWPQTLAGGSLRLVTIGAEEALTLGRRLAPYLGVDGETLQSSRDEPTRTLARVAFRLNQTYRGLPVYQAQLAIFATLPSGEIGLINSSLQQITNAKEGPALSSGRAASEFEATSSKKVTEVSGPIYFVRDGVAYPAWIAIATAKNSADSFSVIEEEVVIDGNSGKVLHRQPTMQF